MKRRLSVSLCLFLATTFGLMPLARALPEEDLEAIYRDSVHYKIPDGSSGCSEGGGGVVEGTTNAEKVWNYFISKGLSPVATAGIMGNFSQESSFDPAVKQNHTTAAIPDGGDGTTGFGIAQWTSQNRQAGLFDKMRSAGLEKYYGEGFGHPEINSSEMPEEDNDALLQIELDYAWEGDSTKIQDLAEKLNDAETVEGDDGSTVMFHRDYERSADGAAQIQERVDDANKFLSEFGGTSEGGKGCNITLGGVSNVEEALPWAMKFIEDTKEEYNSHPKAIAQLADNEEGSGGSISESILVATWPEAGSEFVCWGAFGCDECVTLSGWFVSKMTDYPWDPDHGGLVVNSLEKKGVPTGDEPKPFSVFSTSETSSSFGHTGVVLGVLDSGEVITLENNLSDNQLMILRYDIKKAYSDVKFAYVGDKIKLDGINPNVENGEGE